MLLFFLRFLSPLSGHILAPAPEAPKILKTGSPHPQRNFRKLLAPIDAALRVTHKNTIVYPLSSKKGDKSRSRNFGRSRVPLAKYVFSSKILVYFCRKINFFHFLIFFLMFSIFYFVNRRSSQSYVDLCYCLPPFVENTDNKGVYSFLPFFPMLL